MNFMEWIKGVDFILRELTDIATHDTWCDIEVWERHFESGLTQYQAVMAER